MFNTKVWSRLREAHPGIAAVREHGVPPTGVERVLKRPEDRAPSAAGSRIRRWVAAFLALGLAAVAPRAEAQGFGFSVVGSPDSLSTNDQLTYTITVTNLTGLRLSSFFVTNSLSASAVLINATPAIDAVETNANNLVFGLSLFNIGTTAQFTLTVQPLAIGTLTNSVVAVDLNTGYLAYTNLTTQVTNVTVINADLGVSLTGPRQAVIVNDLTSYGVAVTNQGPDSAPNVMLTNSLPAEVKFIGISPSRPVQLFGTNLVLNVGTVAGGGYTNFALNIQPTNTGTFSFSARVGAAGVTDTNTSNDLASTNIVVGDYLSTNVVVSLVDATQHLDTQNGLMEQVVRLTNMDTNSMASVRLVVSGLTPTNRLVNAWGTNEGNPFVGNPTSLAPAQSADLLLQYYVPSRSSFTLTTNQLHAFSTPAVNLTPPSNLGTAVAGLSIYQLVSGRVLIQFPSLSNRVYTVVYYGNLSSNGYLAFPAGVASADQSQWIDYGPPETTSAPTNAGARFYRVFLNP